MTGKRIVLVEWNWMGHHPTYFVHFVLALEELGADVLAICPKPDEARQTVGNLRRQHGLGPARDGQTVYRQVMFHDRRFQGIRPTRVSAIDWTLRHFGSIEGLVKKWQVESERKVDLVFYACIYDWNFDWFQFALPFLSLPWSGLYLHALSLRMPGKACPVTGRLPCPEKIFRGPLCKGVAILDEGMALRFEAVTDKPVVVFPDLTDERFPTSQNGRMLENRLKRFADGSQVIGLFGNLQKSKGVIPLALASRHPRITETCFAMAGEVWWPSFSPQETETIIDVLTNGENMWNHLLRIPDEAQVNSLLSACDVLYAAYLDFPHSSNIMTKAALLKKPLIVSEGYLMAERVQRFRMGEVVPQGNMDALVDAISKITKNPEAWVAENQPRWSDYCREHSFQRLKEAFHDLLAKL